MKAILVLWFSACYSNITVSQYVDDMEPLLQYNRETYLAGPHTLSRRDTAILYFDQQFAWLKSSAACGNKLLGASGKKCISERTRDGVWPWETYYRDPIVNTPLQK